LHENYIRLRKTSKKGEPKNLKVYQRYWVKKPKEYHWVLFRGSEYAYKIEGKIDKTKYERKIKWSNKKSVVPKNLKRGQRYWVEKPPLLALPPPPPENVETYLISCFARSKALPHKIYGTLYETFITVDVNESGDIAKFVEDFMDRHGFVTLQYLGGDYGVNVDVYHEIGAQKTENWQDKLEDVLWDFIHAMERGIHSYSGGHIK
jgi:hypothetical protein